MQFLNIRTFDDAIICSLVHREQRIGANRSFHFIKSCLDSSVSVVTALYPEHPREHGSYCQQILCIVQHSVRNIQTGSDARLSYYSLYSGSKRPELETGRSSEVKNE
jgi:hypothetical protein